MDNVLILFNMEEEKSRTILFRYGAILKELKKDELFKFLLTRSLKINSGILFYNSVLKAVYTDAYDFILKHLDEANCIQVYRTNAIHLWSGNRQFSKLTVFEDRVFCNHWLTSAMLKELIVFVKNN